jgi:hypothetical protein
VHADRGQVSLRWAVQQGIRTLSISFRTLSVIVRTLSVIVRTLSVIVRTLICACGPCMQPWAGLPAVGRAARDSYAPPWTSGPVGAAQA